VMAAAAADVSAEDLGADEDYAGEEEDYGDEAGEDGDDADVDEKDVLVLTSDIFESTLKENKFVLVEFYAPWCGHCKALKPEYANAATTLKEEGVEVVLAKVDATEESDIAEKNNVEGYPTLKWFVDGTPADYEGGRDADAIVAWVKKRTGPPAETVETAKALDEMITKADEDKSAVVLGCFAKLEGEPHAAYEEAAREVDGPTYAQTTDAKLCKAHGGSLGDIIVIRTYAGGNKIYKGDGSAGAAALKSFLRLERLDWIELFSQDNAWKIFDAGDVTRQVILFASGDELDEGEETWDAFLEMAKKYRGKLVAVAVNTDTEEASQVAEYFGVAGDEATVVGFDGESDSPKKYRMTDEKGELIPFSKDGLETFMKKFDAGELTPHVKSAPAPTGAKMYEGGVRVVVGSTVNEIAKDPTKDVLLEVYAPWCGHCKQIAPIYKKLAKRLKSIDSVVIAKMDGTENEHPDLAVEGFPTIVFFPAREMAENEQPVSFDGERTLDGMLEWVHENANVPFEKPAAKSSGKGKKSERKEEL